MAKFKNAATNYFQESYHELKKVTWPTRNQAIRMTFIVLGFCFAAAALMWVLDLTFNRGFQLMVLNAQKIFPPTVTTPVNPTLPVDTVQPSVGTEETATTPPEDQGGSQQGASSSQQ